MNQISHKVPRNHYAKRDAGPLLTQQQQTTITPVDPGTVFKDPLLRLLRRTSFGLTPDQIAKARKMGFSAYLEYQLNYTAIDDSVVDAELKRKFPRIFLTPQQLSMMNDWQTWQDLVHSTIWRATYSEKQLYEVMVEFWTDHFNTFVDKIGSNLEVKFNRDMICKYALDTFPNLLSATAHSGGMMTYLDNDSNSGASPNQNYGRELMELHTLGVNGGYTQMDVIEVSRCFTGWTFQWDNNMSNYGEFVYDGLAHDDAAKTVLGHKFAAGGQQQDGENVLKILSAHPSTALHISQKLAHWLLDYNPSQALVESVANVYMQTQGDIKSMIRTILTPENLSACAVKFKRPYHLYISALRALDPVISDLGSVLGDYIDVSNQTPFEWAPPNGYPDAVGVWSGFLLPRWNFALNIMSDGVWGMMVDIDALLGTATTLLDVENHIQNLVFGGEMLASDRKEINVFLKARPFDEDRLRGAFALAIASPSFQWY